MRLKTQFTLTRHLALAVAACATLLPAALKAAIVPVLPKLVWDANPEPDVTGYRVHIGSESGNYTTVFDISGDTSTVLPPVPKGSTMYLAVSAVNADGLESPRSTELVVIADSPAPVVSPSFAMSGAGQGKLQWKYPLNAGIPANSFTVYASEDLVNWTPASEIQAASPTRTDSQWQYFEFPYQADKPRMFFKVGASNPFGETL